LPALEIALDADRMALVLASAVGIEPAACSAEVLAYKPGQRATIRYSLDGLDLIGKVYGRQVLAERVAGWIQAVGEPEPLAVVPELGLLIRPYVPGDDLRHALGSPAMQAAARRIAALHAASPPAGVKPKSLEHELAKVARWCEEIAEVVAPAQAHSRVHAFAARAGAAAPALVHRDFYYANVVWDGARAWLLDFDELGVGDPAFDVGHFLAHLEVLGYRANGDFDANARAADRFLRAYPPIDPARLALWRTYTFLKLAATEVRRQRPGWSEQCRAFVARACSAVTFGPPPSGGDGRDCT
jgi:hypothetical protein